MLSLTQCAFNVFRIKCAAIKVPSHVWATYESICLSKLIDILRQQPAFISEIRLSWVMGNKKNQQQHKFINGQREFDYMDNSQHFINRICAWNNNKGELTSNNCTIECLMPSTRLAPSIAANDNIEIAYLFFHKMLELATCRMLGRLLLRISINFVLLFDASRVSVLLFSPSTGLVDRNKLNIFRMLRIFMSISMWLFTDPNKFHSACSCWTIK